MSVASEITRLLNAKADLKTAIEGKGVTVPSSTKLDGYADLVDSIETGGGGGNNYTYIAVEGLLGLSASSFDCTEKQIFDEMLQDWETFTSHPNPAMTYYYRFRDGKFTIPSSPTILGIADNENDIFQYN